MLELSSVTSATDLFFKTYDNPYDPRVLAWASQKGHLLPLISYENSTQFGTMNIGLTELVETYDWIIVARTDIDYSPLLMELIRSFDFYANQNWITVINVDQMHRTNDVLLFIPQQLKQAFMQAVKRIAFFGLDDLHTLGLAMPGKVRILSHMRFEVRQQNPFYRIDGMK